MKADADILLNKDLFAPIIFRSDFNKFKIIDSNQAWSLFFTAGKKDKEFGSELELGRFFTNLLIAVGVSGIVWAVIFTNIA